jgi:hypothetical protein
MLEELGNIKKDIQEYIEIRLDLLKLQVAENISGIISSITTGAIVILFISLTLFFLSLAAGYYIASLLHSNELGFLCVAGFYFLLMLIILLLRKKIIDRPVIKSVVKIFYSKASEDAKK